jgi:hypothetical protein
MAMFISRREVFNNLMRFKQCLGGQVNGNLNGDRIYKGMVDCKTGEIQFPEAQLPKYGLGGWKEIQFEVNTKNKGVGFFEAREVNHHPLDSGNMTPVAVLLVMETIQALNEITAHSPAQLPEKAAFDGLSNLEIPSFRAIEMMPGWIGKIDRMQAEKELNSKPIGTYLLRNGDSFTEVIAQRLMEGNKMGVEVFICTLVEPEDKISDILILLTDKGWVFYRDNPDLLDSEYVYHSTPEILLEKLGKRLKYTV